MNLERSQKRIRDLMSLFVKQVEGATAMGQTDINKVAETILIPLIAEVYGYKNLKNLNFTEGSNFPSVDLGDETARVAFQITATPGIEKVKHTLTKFVEYKLYEKYDRIIIYIITEKQKTPYSDTVINRIIQGKFSFDTQKDIWDWRNILGEVTKFQIEKTREVEKILEVNFGEERREPDWEVVDKVEQIINESTELFVGRSEEFQKLDNFLADNSSGVMLVTAAAGFGKTSLLANWVKERQGNDCFIAYHFFSQQYDKTRSVKSAYWNLLRQIYRYYELYYEQLPNELDELRKRLYNILKERDAREDEPLVIVIDALDEIDAADIPFSLPFLTSLPQNVFVIASARAELGEEPKYLENWSERSQNLHLEDLPRGAIADWLKQTGDGELVTLAQDETFVTQVCDRTEGIPLFLKYLIDELVEVAQQGDESAIRQTLAATPKGFAEYIRQQYQILDRLKDWLSRPDLRKIFYFLTIAKGELSSDDLVELMGESPVGLPWQISRWFKIRQLEHCLVFSFAHSTLAEQFAVLPEISISFIRASALAIVAEVQVKNAQKEVGATTARIACEIAQNIDNPAEKTNLLARIVQILVEAENIQEAKIICDRAFEIAQQISENREHQRSQSFGLIAQAQARVGEFDAALRTIKVIPSPFYQADALRSLAQLQIVTDSQQIKKFKSTLSQVHEFYKSADPLSFEVLNGVELLTIIAVARSTVGETEAALATFADLLEAAKTQKQRERDRDLSTIAIGYAEVGEFPTAIEIINEIEDGAHKISALWAIAWEELKKGKQITILDIALAAKEKIEDEKKRLQALKRIAKIQVIAGKGEEAVRTVEAIITDRNKHLPDIALWFAETGDRVNFKHLLIPCVYYLDAAYQMCGYLARLYPEQASAVAKVLTELNGKGR